MATAESTPLEKKLQGKTGYLLSHCILNMNTRAPGISVWRGSIIPLLESLEEIVEHVHQLPCHEEYYMGARRWWQVYEQYSHSLFREKSRLISESYAGLLKREGYAEVRVLGLGLSPTCAVRETQKDETWGGRPREIDTSSNIGLGKGVFMEILEETLIVSGFKVSMHDVSPALIYPGNRVEATKSYPRTPDASMAEICSFLGVNCNYTYPRDKLVEKTMISSDARSYRNIVMPRSFFVSSFHKALEKAREGYGLILVDDFCFDETTCEFMSKVYSHMLRNLLQASHHVTFLLHPSPEMDFLSMIIDGIGPRRLWDRLEIISAI